ncbi:MAG: hypothetical protein PHC46_00245 [Clostridia bacterium]|nr:hypothetical protein [Clostridia bacterium]
MKKILAIILPMVLITGLLYGYVFNSNIGSVMAYVSVDINPSVQFVTDGANEVVSVTAANDDGETILLGEVDNLIGLSIEEATERIVELAIEYGYLDPEALADDPNAITITTVLESQNIRLQARLRDRVKTHLENFFKNNGIYGVIMTDLDMADIIAEAETLGVGAGNLKLIRSIQAVYPDVTTEQALNLSVKDMMDMLRGAREVESYIEYLDSQIIATQTQIDALNLTLNSANANLILAQDEVITLNATLDAANASLILAQAELVNFEAIDTTEYTVEDLAIYDTQLAANQLAVTDLETEIVSITTQIATAELTASDLQAEVVLLTNQIATLNITLSELQSTLGARQLYLNTLQLQAQTKKGAALDKYEDWQANKVERSEQVKAQWKNFQNNLTEEQIDSILDSIQATWQTNRP